MSTLDRALQIAAHAHEKQVDKQGQPYILHVLRVVVAMETDEQRFVAALHDVIEDSEWTMEDLEDQAFLPHILDAVYAISRFKGERYVDYIERCAANQLAREVKMRDVIDNLDRAPSLGSAGEPLVRRYRAALRVLRYGHLLRTE
jgi:(p)ppGpp synthase/HD superfamily hydrolase